jgi:uncharacterized membrane protein YesL
MFFTLSGLVLFGIFPATAAMFAVLRKWTLGDGNGKVLGMFWFFFKREFWKSQILGFLFLLIGFILFMDLKFFFVHDSFFSKVMLFITINITVVFLIQIVYLFPSFVHFEWKLSQYLKQPLFIGLVNPLFTILMIAGIIVLLFLFGYIPLLIPFFGASGIACYLTWIAQKSFRNVVDKKNKLQSSSLT